MRRGIFTTFLYMGNKTSYNKDLESLMTQLNSTDSKEAGQAHAQRF